MRRMYTTQGIQKIIDDSIENNEIIDKFEYNETDDQLESSKKIVAPEFDGENAKPLYWHGLDMYDTSDGKRVSCVAHLLLNDGTIITTLDQLEQIVKAKATSSNADVDIAITGAVLVSGNYFVGYNLRYVKNQDNFLLFYINSSTGYQSAVGTHISSFFVGVSDNVNKIN